MSKSVSLSYLTNWPTIQYIWLSLTTIVANEMFVSASMIILLWHCQSYDTILILVLRQSQASLAWASSVSIVKSTYLGPVSIAVVIAVSHPSYFLLSNIDSDWELSIPPPSNGCALYHVYVLHCKTIMPVAYESAGCLVWRPYLYASNLCVACKCINASLY